MSLLVKSESISLLAARGVTAGVQPTAGWNTQQPNPDGLGDFYPKLKTVQPSPLTKLRQMERPKVVDADAVPKVTQDITKDWLDFWCELWFFARAKHPGGTGLAYFTPTARTTTDYTVAALGALPAGTLVATRGFVNAANNGLFQVGASSTGTAIKVSGGVAETVSGYVATLEVAGWRGASGDIGLDVNGNLTSTVADFTTMGLPVGGWIWVGGTIGSGHDFATAAYRGFAKITAVSAHLLTLARRSWTVAAADTGATKTIDLYWGRWLRSVAFDDADYSEISAWLELGLPGIGAVGATEYVYAQDNLLDQLKLTFPLAGIPTVEATFLGTTVADPTTSRATGASTANAVLATDRFTTANLCRRIRVTNQATEAIVSADIDNWALTYMNHVVGQKQQGVLGNARAVTGKVELGIDLMAYLTQDEGWKACSQNTTLAMDAAYSNSDGAFLLDVPSLTYTDAPPKFPGNGPASLSVKAAGFRDAVGNYTLGMTMFPYLPTA